MSSSIILNIIFLPLFSGLFSIFLGRRIGYKGSQFITTISVAISFFLSLYLAYNYTINGITNTKFVLNWISSDLFIGSWDFLLDSLTVTMLIVVTSISTLVHIYSIEYMRNDPHITRFMSYLTLFTFFMLMLVTAGNFITIIFRLGRSWFMLLIY